MNVPVSDEARMLAFAAKDARRYPLSVILSRNLPAHPPPETWTHDAAGRLLPAARRPDWSPEAGRGDPRAGRSCPLRKICGRAPIAIVLNGGEYALACSAPPKNTGSRIRASCAAKGNTGWFEYVPRKAEMETAIADACRRAAPTALCYYTAGGGTHRDQFPGWETWTWGYLSGCAHRGRAERGVLLQVQ